MVCDELCHLCAIVGFLHGINIIAYCMDVEHTGYGTYSIWNIPDM